MIKSKSFKRYQFIINFVMILVTLCMVLPLVLLFMSSVSSEASLLRDGYSFLIFIFF